MSSLYLCSLVISFCCCFDQIVCGIMSSLIVVDVRLSLLSALIRVVEDLSQIVCRTVCFILVFLCILCQSCGIMCRDCWDSCRDCCVVGQSASPLLEL